MPSAADRIDFGPPPDAGGIRSFGLALLIHVLLIVALTWGVNWKRSSDSSATMAAELWSDAPQDAVPMAATALQAALAPEIAPAPTPDADIALEQEKKRKRMKDQQTALEKAELELAKRLQAQAQAQAQAQTEQKQKQAQQATDKQRDDVLKRMNELMASANGGSAGSTGSTSRASAGGKGTSSTYGAIARAAIIPNVVFTEAFDGNPLTKVEVRLTLDGTIISSSIVQPSGNKNWDNAVLNAVSRTRVMPKDVDGKLPDTILILEFKPRF